MLTKGELMKGGFLWRLRQKNHCRRQKKENGEMVAKTMNEAGFGVTISNQSGHRMPQLGNLIDEQLAITPTEKRLSWKKVSN